MIIAKMTGAENTNFTHHCSNYYTTTCWSTKIEKN